MNIDEEIHNERQSLLRQRSLALVGIGIPVLAIFGAGAVLDREWQLVILVTTSILIIASGHVAMLRGYERTSIIRPSVATLSVLFIYLILHSGDQHSRALWFFALPVVSIMLLPPREGALWAATSIAVAGVIMALSGAANGTSAYSAAFTLRFVITAAMISGCLLWAEIALHRYQEKGAAQKAAIQAESARLNDEINRRGALEDELRVLASTDALTGLVNRRAFMERFAHELLRSQRHGPSPTLLILDIDFFKKINDTYGHPAGDAVLVHVAHVLRTSLRNLDIIARIGGEEFAVTLVETNSEMAEPVIDRLLQRFRSSPATLADGTLLSFTASIGSTEIRWGDTSDTAIRRADEALYTAKNSGRDCHRRC
jgi:diguanylate cyclase (GGDEF)-like protein